MDCRKSVNVDYYINITNPKSQFQKSNIAMKLIQTIGIMSRLVKKYLGKGAIKYLVLVSAVDILMSTDKLCMIKKMMKHNEKYNHIIIKIHYSFISLNEGSLC